MKLLYSNFLKFPQSIISHSSLEMAKISHFLIKKSNVETIFVGDSESINYFSSVPYDQILNFDDRINYVPKCMWSAGKLIALSMIHEPVIHIDFDLFFLKPINLERVQKPIVCFHKEEILTHYKNLYDQYIKIAPINTLKIDAISYNSAIIGGTNTKVINSCINELIELIIKNRNQIDKIYLSLKNNTKICKFNIPAVLLEQIWLYQLYKFKNQDIFTYLDGDVCLGINNHLFYSCELNINAMNNGIIHFQKSKSFKEVQYATQKLCEILNI